MTAPYFDPIELALNIIGRVGPHSLPASRSVASAPKTPTSGAHMLPTSVSEAAPTLRAHALPPMRTMIPQSPEPAPTFDSAPITEASLPPISTTPSVISDLYHGLLATHPLNPQAQQNIAQQGAPQGGMPPVEAMAPNPSMAGPQAAQLPSMPPSVAPEAPKRTGMLQRIAGLLGGDESGPYAGLLSANEQKEGKVSPLWWLLGPAGGLAGRDMARQRLDRIMGLKQYATQLADQQTARATAQRIANARATIDQKITLPSNPSSSDLMNFYRQRESFLLAAGDSEGAKQEAENLRSAMGMPDRNAPKLMQPGNELVGPDGRVIHTTPSLPKDFEPKPYIDKNGKSIWVQPGQPIPDGAKPLNMATTEVRVDASSANAAANRGLSDINKGIDRFTRNTKPLRDRAAVIDQALQTIDDAAHNPDPNVRKTLYTSAVANFIQAADQKAQIRWQLLNYFKANVDPSIAGKWEILKSRLLNGTLPGYTMEGMLQHLNNIKGLVQREIEAQRAGEIKRHPELDGELPETSEYFPITSMGGGSAATAPKSAGDLYSKYGLTPKKP